MSFKLIFLHHYEVFQEKQYFLMRKPVSWVKLTAFFIQVVNLAHEQVLFNEFILGKIEQFLDYFTVTVNVKKVVLIKLLL